MEAFCIGHWGNRPCARVFVLPVTEVNHSSIHLRRKLRQGHVPGSDAKAEAAAA